MKTLITLTLILSAMFGYGQILPCGTTEQPINTLVLSKQQVAQLAEDNTIRTIPVVFHIVYNDIADSILFAGGMNNQRIAIQMQVMNECFRNRNADAAEVLDVFKPVAADSKIEFCLNEVRYKKTTVAPYFPINDAMKQLPTGSPAKDPFKYLNIWVCRLNDGVNGIGGYAYYPTSGAVGQWFDGVVSHTTYVGGDDRRTGEVTVHEIGHYLYLAHTFNRDKICTGVATDEGDWCDDTPATDAPAGRCNLTRQACGHLTMNQNYMEYTDCSALFSEDQAARMTATLLGIRNALWSSGTCSGTPGNPPPTCAITFPANGQTFPANSNITINVLATDNGSISNVEFYNGTTLLNTDVTLPYAFIWPNVATGSYTLTAKATDNGGAVTTSGAVNITVGAGTPPVCNLISPVNGATFTFPAAVKFEATATDADGIAKVEYYINNSLINIPLTASPYVLYWSASVGSFSIKARATDKSGASTISQTATITVTNQGNTPPVVSITAPANNATFTAPASIPITVTATDNTGVSRVEFYNGNSRLGTDNTAPYALTWNSVPAGNYTLTARAYDTQGASSVSSPVSVIVKSGVTDSPVKEIILLQNNSLKFKAEDGRERTIP